MTPELAKALRAAARSALPEGAFLKRARGEGLFITDAPRLRPNGNWREALEAAGFVLSEENGLVRLSPAPTVLSALEARFPEPPDALSASLFPFAGRPPEPESLALFALGARVLDGGDGRDAFDRRLRQRAAVCLRLNSARSTNHGGGLYACALLITLMKEANP